MPIASLLHKPDEEPDEPARQKTLPSDEITPLLVSLATAELLPEFLLTL